MKTWRNRKAREEDESESYILSNSFLLELVTKMPTSLEDIVKLRKKFSRKTAQCFSEIISIISRAQSRVKEEERSGSLPVKGGITKSDWSKRHNLSLNINELKADDSMHELAIKISKMSITVQTMPEIPKASSKKTKGEKVQDKPAENTLSSDFFSNGLVSLPKRTTTSSKTKASFKYASHLDFLREIYPGVTIQPTKKRDIKIDNEISKQKAAEAIEQPETSEFIGIGDNTADIVRSTGDTADIIEKMDSSLLPSSLKEKFKVDLLKIKKKDFTAKAVIQKKASKANQMQATSRDIFEKGNVFEVLKSKDIDRISDDEGNSRIIPDAGAPETEDQPKKFWDVYDEMSKKHSQAPKKQGPQVGEFGGAKLTKKKQEKHKKAQFSQPSIKNNVKF